VLSLLLLGKAKKIRHGENVHGVTPAQPQQIVVTAHDEIRPVATAHSRIRLSGGSSLIMSSCAAGLTVRAIPVIHFRASAMSPGGQLNLLASTPPISSRIASDTVRLILPPLASPKKWNG